VTLKHLFKGTKWDMACERCGVKLSECQCPPPAPPAPAAAARLAPGEQRAQVRIEKRPNGKKVTTVAGLAPADLEELGPKLKALCGAGGTVKEGKLEVQGDHKEKVARELERLGYRTKTN
jgi:translation initiation factor 1